MLARLSLLVVVPLLAAMTAAPARADVISSIEGTVLTVTGTAGADDVSIDCHASAVRVHSDGATAHPGDYYPCDQVTEIVVNLGGGNDDFYGLGQLDATDWVALAGTQLYGGDGDDDLAGSEFDDTIDGGEGADHLTGNAGVNTLHGGPGTDQLATHGDADVVLTATTLTGRGTDTFDGVERAWVSFYLEPSTGRTLDASAFPGAVDVHGSGLDDSIITGPGDDRINPVGGSDEIVAGDGMDTLEVSNGNLHMRTVTLSQSSLDVTNEFGPDLHADLTSIEHASMQTWSGDQVVDTRAFVGSTDVALWYGNDTFLGGPGADSVRGDWNRDTIRTRGGDDTLYGGGQADLLIGGLGNDECVGGPGIDTIKACETVSP